MRILSSMQCSSREGFGNSWRFGRAHSTFLLPCVSCPVKTTLTRKSFFIFLHLYSSDEVFTHALLQREERRQA